MNIEYDEYEYRVGTPICKNLLNTIQNLNTERVWYLSPHCIALKTLIQNHDEILVYFKKAGISVLLAGVLQTRSKAA